MPTFTPVDHDPFAPTAAQPRLTPVESDPFKANDWTWGGVAKQTGLGLGVDLPVSTLGIVGDVGNAGADTYEANQERIYQQSPFPTVSRVLGSGPNLMRKAMSYLPTSEQIMGGVEKVTGPIPQPQNTPEKIGRFAGPFLSMVKGGKPNLKHAPSVDELRALKDAAYNAAETGIGKVKMTRTHVSRLQRDLNEVANKVGKGGTFSPIIQEAYAKSFKIVDQLNGVGKDIAAGKTPPPNFNELEKLRQGLRKLSNEAVDAHGNLTADGHMASEFIDKIDELMQHTPFIEARKFHMTLRKAEMIEDAVFRAEMAAGANFTQAGFETALRQQFRQMAVQLNKKNWRGWKEDEKNALLLINKTGRMQNITRLAGAMAPKGALSQTLFTMLGIASPGIAAPLAIGTTLAKSRATKMGIQNVNRLDETVRNFGVAPPASQRSRLPSRLGRTALSVNAATRPEEYQ